MSKIKIGVLGLGYVGLPIFLSLKKNFKTIGFDIDHKRISDLKRGYDKNFEFKKNQIITNKNSHYSCNIDDLKKCNFFIVTVPTPVNLNKKPDLGPLFSACSILFNP